MRKTDVKWALKNLDAVISMLCIGCLVLLSFAGVIARYVLVRPFSWLEEMELIITIWSVFMGGSYAFRKRAHIGIELIVDSLPVKAKMVVTIITEAVVVLTLLAFGYYGLQAVQLYIEKNNVTSILGVPYALKYISVPLGCLLMVISSIKTTISTIRSLSAGEKVAE